MKGPSPWLLCFCLCGLAQFLSAQPQVNVRAVLERPLTNEALGYHFQPLVLNYPVDLKANASSIREWYLANAHLPQAQTEQFPADGKSVLSVFVLHNPGQDTARLIFPLPTLKTKLKFGMIRRENGRSTHFYNEISSWNQQSYQGLVYRPEEGKVLLVVPPLQNDTVFVVCKVAKKHQFQLYSAQGYQELTSVPALHYLMFYVALLSFLSFSMLLGIIQYLQQRDVAFIYYVIYLSLMWFLIFRRLEKINPFLDLGLYFPATSWWWEHLRAPAYLLSFVAYQIFIYYLLRDRVHLRWLEKFIIWSNVILVCLIPVHYLTKVYWERLDFMQAVLAPLAIFWIWNFVKLYQRKLGVMVGWVLFGSFLAAVGTILGNFIGTRLGGESPLTFLHIGDMPLHLAIVVDVLCLAVALSFRHHSILRDRNEAQNLALKTAKENAKHAKTLSLAKKLELDQRKLELQKQSEGLIQQQLKVINTQRQQALAETELLALREQLKPHFVANCINSIRNLIARDKAGDASLYLSKLGILLGQIFELTEKSTISLREELDLLKLYLDLEQLRFRDRFKVVFELDPDIDLDAIQLPPLLLQPYAENAIKHAFKDNSPHQALVIAVTKNAESTVLLSIEDNGIGREASAENGRELSLASSGVGMGLCADRLKLFNERFNQDASINIVDLAKGGTNTGTRVEIHFPFPKTEYHDDQNHIG
ncbi:MAG: histidine kinase [Haliscomenobacter sp.]|uniref:sensor histidine kinase n=1 Tax=Haliscomenobacter sp. TaxID=2717303 RepID=UPI0029A3416D|nr:histidine kinase [Haliscomenobacter sp.]MDX2070561.1 histidine kinase [Haliscomenobacter sp.]